MAKEKKAIRRVVSVEFWRDDKVLELFTPEDKLFMLYLLTNPQSTQLGVYHVSKKTMAFELGYSIESISVLLDRFEHTYEMIKYSPETHEVAIKNYLRHSILNGGAPVEDLLRKEISEVKNRDLLDWAFKSIIADEKLNQSVKNIIREFYSADNEPVDESVNESYHESGDESYHESYHESYPINNQLSIINIRNNRNARARACAYREPAGEPAAAAEENPFGDCDESRPPTDTVELYATNNLRKMSPGNMQELGEFINDYGLPDDLVRFAIDEACGQSKAYWNYVASILYRYLDAGIKTVADAKAEKERYRKSCQRSAKPTSDEQLQREIEKERRREELNRRMNDDSYNDHPNYLETVAKLEAGEKAEDMIAKAHEMIREMHERREKEQALWA